jgi:hypothetical protein
MLISEDFVWTGAFKKDQATITIHTIELSLDPLMAWHELTIFIAEPLIIN